MKNLFCLLTSLLISVCLYTQEVVENPAAITNQENCTLTVHLTGLESNEGKLMVGLYNSKETWLGDGYKGDIVSIENNEATVVFEDVPYGVYGASAVHDVDSNGKMNTKAFGIPSEPYASSRGAKGMFGPPKWVDAKFTLSAPEVTEAIKF